MLERIVFVVFFTCCTFTSSASGKLRVPEPPPSHYQWEALQRLKNFTDLSRVKVIRDEIHDRFHNAASDNSPMLAEYKKTDFFESYRAAQHWLADEVQLLRIEMKRVKPSSPEYQNVILKAQTLFVTAFNVLYEYWDGTDYDYNGLTRFPQYGKIACGGLLYRIMRALGVMSPEKIKSFAPIYQGKEVWLWQGAPEEQILAYGANTMISSNGAEEKCAGRHLECLLQAKIDIMKNSEPFFLVGVPCHVFIVTRDFSGRVLMYHALGTTEKREILDVQKLCGDDKIFLTSWEPEHFKNWIFTFKL